MNLHPIHRSRTAAVIISAAMLAVVVPTVTASTAAAATQTITVTAKGFVPMNLSIKVGDTITFSNTDTTVHEVLFKATSGFTCTVAPLVIQPDKSQSCTWSAVGTYTYSDPNQRDSTFRGTVKVAAATPVVVPTVSLAVSGDVVRYGAATTLSGKVTPTAAGTAVDILAQAFGETAFTKVSSVVTTNGGTFSVDVTPEIATSYRAEYQSGTTRVVSSVTPVSVRPAVGLVVRSVQGSRARLTTRATSSIDYEGAFVRVQRQNSLGGWTTMRTVTLGAFSSVRFAARTPNGTTRIRVVMPSSQAGDGYLAGTSRTITLSR